MENKRENFNEEVSLEENSAKANNAEMAKKTILVVDDEKPIVDILTYNLQKEGYSTLEANDGEEAIKIATEKKPDLILLDIMLPKVDGLTVCKKLRHTLNVPILILSAKDEEIDKILGLELGADDYITKPFRNSELISRIRSVLRRYTLYKKDKNILNYGTLKINLDKAKVFKNSEEIYLTNLEYKILLMFINNANHIITRDELLAKVWDIEGNYVNDNTLSVYIKRLRLKISDNNKKSQSIQTVRGMGYILNTISD